MGAGNQKNYRKAEYLLYKHWQSWLDAIKLYSAIKAPVALIYGEHDWSNPQEREDRKQRIPSAKFIVIPAAGHFSSLEAPKLLAEIVSNFPQ